MGTDRILKRALAAAGCLCAASAVCAQSEPTTIDEVVMFGVDDDSHELVRYEFGSDEVEVIGTIQFADGEVITEIESLAYIPGGWFAYAVWNYDGTQRSRLVKINLLNAQATELPNDTGFGDVEGLTAVESGGGWELLAVHQHESGPRRELISIDPATGIGERVMTLSARYHGLARGPGGTLYVAQNDRLLTLDPGAGTETLIGAHGYQNIEALEFAYGPGETNIIIDGVDAEFYENGVLFAFSDSIDSLLLISPTTGSAMVYPTALDMADIEGIIFFTSRTDPVRQALAARVD